MGFDEHEVFLTLTRKSSVLFFTSMLLIFLKKIALYLYIGKVLCHSTNMEVRRQLMESLLVPHGSQPWTEFRWSALAAVTLPTKQSLVS